MLSIIMQSNIRISRKPEELSRYGFSNSTFYLRIQQGLIPPPISLGGRAVGWVEHENQAVLNAMIAGKTNEEIKALVISLVESRKDGAQ